MNKMMKVSLLSALCVLNAQAMFKPFSTHRSFSVEDKTGKLFECGPLKYRLNIARLLNYAVGAGLVAQRKVIAQAEKSVDNLLRLGHDGGYVCVQDARFYSDASVADRQELTNRAQALAPYYDQKGFLAEYGEDSKRLQAAFNAQQTGMKLKQLATDVLTDVTCDSLADYTEHNQWLHIATRIAAYNVWRNAISYGTTQKKSGPCLPVFSIGVEFVS